MAIAEPPLPPPHDLEAEQSRLGAIFLSDVTLYGLVIQDGLKPEDFYREQHRVVYQAMMELYNASEPVDIVTVKNRLREAGRLDDVGGEAGVESLAGMVPAAGNLRPHAPNLPAPAPPRAHRPRPRAPAQPADDHDGDPGQRALARRRAARPGRTRREGDARRRA